MGKESPCNSGDVGLIPGLGRTLGRGHDNLRQYSCLGNPMDRGAWWATVRRVAKSRTRLKGLIIHACTLGALTILIQIHFSGCSIIFIIVELVTFSVLPKAFLH